MEPKGSFTHLHLVPRSRMRGAIPPLPNTPSWSDAQLKKHMDNFTFTRRFTTLFRGIRHWSLSRARWIQSKLSYPVSLRSSLLFSSHLWSSFSSDLFPSGLSIKILYCTHLSFLPCVLTRLYGEDIPMTSPRHVLNLGEHYCHPNRTFLNVKTLIVFCMFAAKQHNSQLLFSYSQ
jgi:hypothetical protein